MAITLAVVDNADGTGAVATVAGSVVTDTNTLTSVAWPGTTGTLTFGAVGSRTGDGTIAAAVANGLWLWKLESVTLASVKTVVLVYQPTTGGASNTSVLYRIMNQVATQITALSLTGVSAANIVVKWLPRMLESTTDPVPEIIVCPAPMPELDQSYLTYTDHVGYPVLVAAISAQNKDYTANLARNTLWREKIRREFISRGLVGIPEVAYCKAEPQAIISPSWFDKNVLYSAQVFRFTSRETRGN